MITACYAKPREFFPTRDVVFFASSWLLRLKANETTFFFFPHAQSAPFFLFFFRLVESLGVNPSLVEGPWYWRTSPGCPSFVRAFLD